MSYLLQAGCPAIEYINDHAQTLQNEHQACDDEGQLTQRVKEVMVASGGMRLMQASEHGGAQARLQEFFAWVRAVARHNPSAGWVAGVVGVHPWEIALVDDKLADEIYGTDADTWVASPYAPQGKATAVDGGYLLTGEWQYSTGTDHCNWVVLGGIVAPRADGERGQMRHFFLPRGDYEIVPDSWRVMGLVGTGSKNVRVDGAFVPAHRTLVHEELAEGALGHRRPKTLLYQLPFGCVFSGAIAAATFGIAEGAVAQYREYLRTRVSINRVVGKTDPYQQEALAEVAADLAAGIVHVDAMFDAWLEQLERGEPISTAQRLEFRRNQVRAVQRVLFGVDKMLSRAGSAAIWTTRPLEHFWRDLRTAGTHICDAADLIYRDWANHAFDTGERISVMH
ncbi:MAG: acyl-CoA dehydrogenase [Pseudomonadota bacterium]